MSLPQIRERLLNVLGWDERTDTSSTLFEVGLVEVQAAALADAVLDLTGVRPPPDFLLRHPSISSLSQYVLDAQPSAQPATLFLFTGEGAHSKETDVAALRTSASWDQVEGCLRKLEVADSLSSFLCSSVGQHAAPLSPLVTTVINILNADRWRDAGYQPFLVIGHSIGEVAAAYVAGLLSVFDALHTALLLGHIGARLTGAMLHTVLPCSVLDGWSDEQLRIAAINSAETRGGEQVCGVTLSGSRQAVDAWLSEDPHAKEVRVPHPWHHPSYANVPGLEGMLASIPSGARQGEQHASFFLSSTRGRLVERVDADYWHLWLTTPGMVALAKMEVAAQSSTEPFGSAFHS